MNKKSRIGGGGWVHTMGTSSMTMSGLDREKPWFDHGRPFLLFKRKST